MHLQQLFYSFAFALAFAFNSFHFIILLERQKIQKNV